MTPPDKDSYLGRLLYDQESDTHPGHQTDQGRHAPEKPSHVTRWMPLALVAAAATVLVISGAAWLGHQPALTPAAGPESALAPDSGSPSKPVGGRAVKVQVFYVGRTGAGPKLFAEMHRVAGTTQSALQVAVSEAVSGKPLDQDYRAWPVPSGITAQATSGAGVITIDLSGQPIVGSLDPAQARMALQAAVWTADAATNSELPVQFLVRGQPVSDLLVTDTSAPVGPTSAESVLSPVSVSTPTDGSTVPTRFDVRGQAATAEANVVWELKQGATVVRRGFSTAHECCTQSPYTFTVTAPPGSYLLVVHDTDDSNGEGFGITRDTKHITVR